MTLAALLLVVLASFIHASWNLLAKRAASVGPVFVFAYSLIACLLYAPWVVSLILQGNLRWSWAGGGLVLLSGGLHLGYSLCLQRGYRVADLSVVYPVARGTGPLLSSLGAFVILGEPFTRQGLAGLALVVAGILLIATQGKLAALTRPGGQAGVRWGTATGALIASYTVVDAYAVKALGVAPVVLDWVSNLLRVLLLAPLVLRDPARARGAMRGYWGTAVLVGALSPLSYILVLLALTGGAPLSLVAPMREMSMMVGALMGMVILRESVGAGRLAGCGVLIAGVILLSAG
ncbi:EamA family transporter [Rhodobacter lacus]|uniref:EamA family transporter n=1 Tax=Rhodobacter lacus TaxID=1641972 RepID=A0ABW5A9U6_9RHOB